MTKRRLTFTCEENRTGKGHVRLPPTYSSCRHRATLLATTSRNAEYKQTTIRERERRERERGGEGRPTAETDASSASRRQSASSLRLLPLSRAAWAHAWNVGASASTQSMCTLLESAFRQLTQGTQGERHTPNVDAQRRGIDGVDITDGVGRCGDDDGHDGSEDEGELHYRGGGGGWLRCC
jgi:hypothetical protein